MDEAESFEAEQPTQRIPYESLQAVADAWRAQLAKERAEMEGQS